MPVATKNEKDLEVQAATDAAADIEADATDETPSEGLTPEQLQEADAAWLQVKEGLTAKVTPLIAAVDQADYAAMTAKLDVGIAFIEAAVVFKTNGRKFLPWAMEVSKWAQSTVEDYMRAAGAYNQASPERKALQQDRKTATPVERWSVLARVEDPEMRETILSQVESELATQDDKSPDKRLIPLGTKTVKPTARNVTSRVRELADAASPNGEDRIKARLERESKAEKEAIGKASDAIKEQLVKLYHANPDAMPVLRQAILWGANHGQAGVKAFDLIVASEKRAAKKAAAK